MRRILGTCPAASIVIAVLGFGAFMLLWAAGIDALSRTIGTGGYLPTEVMEAPRPFAFESPRTWPVYDFSGGWSVLIQSPRMGSGPLKTTLDVELGGRPSPTRRTQQAVAWCRVTRWRSS